MGKKYTRNRLIGIATALGLLLPLLLTGYTITFAAENKSVNDVVKISVESDGTVKKISTVSNQEFDPQATAANLPFRVVNTYTHDGKVSSDSKILTKASGLSRIDIAVYNVTGKLQTVSADVNGRSISRQTVVSTPLSVAAEVSLPGIKPSQIITGEDASPLGSTNGVVGVDENGNTFVQWAALTGIGKTGSVARFSLVVDTKDFAAPQFNVAVQPGFGINPDSAEHKHDSELILSTLKTLSEAGNVLEESGEALNLARKILTDAGTQIGAQTIRDLQASNSRIESSARTISSTLSILDTQVGSITSSTGKQVAHQLLETTSKVKELLGNPDAQKPTVDINPQSCAILEETGDKTLPESENLANPDSSVLRVISSLTARVEALSKTSDKCKQHLLSKLDSVLGPATPDDNTCQGNEESLSCQSLLNRNKLNEQLEKTYQEGLNLVSHLGSGNQKKTSKKAEDLVSEIEQLGTDFSALEGAIDSSNIGDKLKSIKADYAKLKNSFQKIDYQLTTVKEKVDDSISSSEMQLKRIKNLKTKICIDSQLTKPAGDGTPESRDTLDIRVGTQKIDKTTGNELIKLLSTTDCPTILGGADGLPIWGLRPTSIQGAEEKTIENLNKIAEQIGTPEPQETPETTKIPETSKRGLKPLRVEASMIKAQIEQNYQTVVELLNQYKDSDSTLKSAKKQLGKTIKGLEKASAVMKQETDKLKNHLDALDENLKQYFDNTHALQQEQHEETFTDEVNSVNKSREQAANSSEEVFGIFAKHLSKESDSMYAEGEKAIKSTGTAVEKANDNLADSTYALLTKNQQQFHDLAVQSIADSDAVSTLLAADIGKVLADIGTNNDKGKGLLGAVATSQAHLGVAETKMADSTTHTSIAQSQQRSSQADQLVDKASVRASLARLEEPLMFPSDKDDNAQKLGWFTFYVTTKSSEGK